VSSVANGVQRLLQGKLLHGAFSFRTQLTEQHRTEINPLHLRFTFFNSNQTSKRTTMPNSPYYTRRSTSCVSSLSGDDEEDDWDDDSESSASWEFAAAPTCDEDEDILLAYLNHDRHHLPIEITVSTCSVTSSQEPDETVYTIVSTTSSAQEQDIHVAVVNNNHDLDDENSYCPQLVFCSSPEIRSVYKKTISKRKLRLAVQNKHECSCLPDLEATSAGTSTPFSSSSSHEELPALLVVKPKTIQRIHHGHRRNTGNTLPPLSMIFGA